MSEAAAARWRMALVVLLLANVAALGFNLFASGGRSEAARHIEALQIQPQRIELRGTGTQSADKTTAAEASSRACVAWGPFASGEAAAAEAALAQLALKESPIARAQKAAGGGRQVSYYLRNPDAGTVEQVARLQREFPGTDLKAGHCPTS